MRSLLLMLLMAGVLPGAERLIYTKSFPGSVPAYTSVIVTREGALEYREAVDDDSPLTAQLTQEETSGLFDLAEKLNRFRSPLESGLKVANTGLKTFRYEKDEAHSEAQFNYSQDPSAKSLLDWFERIAETEQLRIGLERSVKFEKLGVNQSLLQLEAAAERKRLVAPSQFLPLLNRVVKSEAYLHMARERAAYLAQAFTPRASQ